MLFRFKLKHYLLILAVIGAVGYFEYSIFEPVRMLASIPASESGGQEDAHLKSVASYLEKEPDAISNLGLKGKYSNPLISHSEPINPIHYALSEQLLNGIEAHGIKERLLEVDSPEKANGLVLDIDDIVEKLESKNLAEEERLIEAWFWLERKYSLNISKELFYKHAVRTMANASGLVDKSRTEDLAWTELNHYLDLEEDQRLKEERRIQFRNRFVPPVQ